MLTVTLNGCERELYGIYGVGILDYEEIVRMAGYPPESSPTVSYRRAGPDADREGTLLAAEAITVDDRTVINCIHTGNT